MPSSPAKRLRDRAHYAANRERIRVQQKAARDANPEKHRARARVYYAAHCETEKAWQRVYRAAHRDEINAKRTAYNVANREYVRNLQRTHRAANADWIRERTRAYRKANADRVKEVARRNQLIKRYGLDATAYTAMLLAQGNACAICAHAFGHSHHKVDAPHVDHNHRTGRVRGILCTKCNMGIGQFSESIESLLGAVSYLQREVN